MRGTFGRRLSNLAKGVLLLMFTFCYTYKAFPQEPDTQPSGYRKNKGGGYTDLFRHSKISLVKVYPRRDSLLYGSHAVGFSGRGTLSDGDWKERARNRKISPSVKKVLETNTHKHCQNFLVFSRDVDSLKLFLKLYSAAYDDDLPVDNVIILEDLDSSILDKVLSLPFVDFVDICRGYPREETLNSFQDLSVNAVNYVHHTHPELTGKELVVSVRERNFEEGDIDLTGRIVNSPLKDPVISFHANQMATVIAGGGNSSPDSKGIAWGARVSSSSFASSFPDKEEYFLDYGITVQNHSYGFGIENFYGVEAMAYDVLANNVENLLHVFSAGNKGEESSSGGVYSGIAGFANLTGNMKMSKNTITVGGHYEDFTVDMRNSKGPAYDGRLKPEIVAFGPEGTSDGAAYVSGISLLLQDAYRERYGQLPTSDMIRMILTLTTDDIGSPGVDFVTGFGAVNAARAVEVTSSDLINVAEVSQGESAEFVIEVPADAADLRLAIAWIDPPANAGAQKALINDLDLQVEAPNGDVVLPFVLNAYAHLDSLSKPAVRRRDSLNNLEVVKLPVPPEGEYIVTVNGHRVSGSQRFSVGFYIERKNDFVWTFPTASDRVTTGAASFLRWSSSDESAAELLVSTDGGEFERIDQEVTLSQNFLRWVAPDRASVVKFAMRIDGIMHESDSFLVSPELDFMVGFDCVEEAMLQWIPLDEPDGYVLYNLSEKYMEPVQHVPDTAFFFNQGQYSDHFAVAPVYNGIIGKRGVTYDYHDKGSSCYYRYLEAKVDGGSILLRLVPSTDYNVEKVLFYKKETEGFAFIGETLSLYEGTYQFIDTQPGKGIITYKAVVVLKDGREIPANEAEIISADDATFLLYPNPVSKAGALNILTDGDELSVQVISSKGEVLRSAQVFGTVFQMPALELTAGIYICRFLRGKDIVQSVRFVVID